MYFHTYISTLRKLNKFNFVRTTVALVDLSTIILYTGTNGLVKWLFLYTTGYARRVPEKISHHTFHHTFSPHSAAGLKNGHDQI